METRIAQEVVLGIGGVRALHALGIEPSVYHLNEGHAAFCTLEIAPFFAPSVASDKIINKFMLCLWQPNSAKPNHQQNW
ncbi:hypothetical protein [Nostoc sp.]|uniref:hypothetical protein n=1 Tax=Nostoc sp. TaxID=1180 RepID=UPI002FF80D25